MRKLPSLLAATICMLAAGAPQAGAQSAPADQIAASVKVGLLVRLDAKPGKEEDVARFLVSGRAIVADEPATSTWFAFRLSPATFYIFDTFPDEAGRAAHLSGKVAAALMANAPELLSRPPTIERADVLAVKLLSAQPGR